MPSETFFMNDPLSCSTTSFHDYGSSRASKLVNECSRAHEQSEQAKRASESVSSTNKLANKQDDEGMAQYSTCWSQSHSTQCALEVLRAKYFLSLFCFLSLQKRVFARVNTFLSLSFNSACVGKTLLPCVRAHILRAFQERIMREGSLLTECLGARACDD